MLSHQTRQLAAIRKMRKNKGKVIRLAIIGYAFMGKAHVDALKRIPVLFELDGDIKLQVLCGRNRTAVRKRARQWGFTRHETDWRKAVTARDVDVVFVLTGNDSHYPIAMAAIRAGKHILCEKPLAMCHEQATVMERSAYEAGIVHGVVQNYRFMPAAVYMADQIARGKIGKIHLIAGEYSQQWGWTANAAWRFQKKLAGSGSGGDLLPHLIDFILALTGMRLDTVKALAQTLVPRRRGKDGKMVQCDVDDHCMVQGTLSNGALFQLRTTRNSWGKNNAMRVSIEGSKGAFEWDLEKPTVVRMATKRSPHFTEISVTGNANEAAARFYPDGHNWGWHAGHVGAIAAFLDAVYKGRKYSPSFTDGAYVMHCLDGILESAEHGTQGAL